MPPMSQSSSPTVDHLQTALTDESGRLVRRVWPGESGPGSLRDAMAAAGERELHDALLRHLRLLDSSLPVVAVAGLVNAGKSSTVATFLSPAGSARVLRGLGDEQATQRFVLWCPRAWEQDAMRRASLLDVLGNVFGTELELLSEDPAGAHRQYNFHEGAGGRFHTPLVAFDEGLDAASFALLDCPDVERKFPGASGEHTSRLRLEVLKRASAIASALLIVANHGGTSKEDFEHMLRAVLAEMPGIPWWLLLNLCRVDYEPHEALEHCAGLAASLEVRGIYLAFDFLHDADEWRRRTPDGLHRLRAGSAKERQPAFYLAEPDPSRNPPNPVDESRFLRRLPGQLQLAAAGGIGGRVRAMHAQRLSEQVAHARERMKAHCAESVARVRRLWESLLRVCSRGYMDAHGQLVVPLTPATAERLRRAFVKSAPLSSRLAMQASLGLGKAAGWIKAGPAWVWSRLQRYLGREGTQHVGRAAAGVEPRVFVNEMIREGFALEAIPDDAERAQIWAEVLARHRQHQPEQLSEADLERAMAEVWEQRGLGARAVGLAAPIALVLILVAFGLAQFDGGATLTAVLAKLGIPSIMTFHAGVILAHQVVGFLSISEILIALGVTAAVAPAGGFQLERMMRKHLALPALANLFACACDVFGLPRRIGGEAPSVVLQGVRYPLPEAKVEHGPAVCTLLGEHESIWAFQPEGWQILSNEMKKLLLAETQSVATGEGSASRR